MMITPSHEKLIKGRLLHDMIRDWVKMRFPLIQQFLRKKGITQDWLFSKIGLVQEEVPAFEFDKFGDLNSVKRVAYFDLVFVAYNELSDKLYRVCVEIKTGEYNKKWIEQFRCYKTLSETIIGRSLFGGRKYIVWMAWSNPLQKLKPNIERHYIYPFNFKSIEGIYHFRNIVLFPLEYIAGLFREDVLGLLDKLPLEFPLEVD